MATGKGPGEERRAGTPDVELARGAWGKAGADGLGHGMLVERWVAEPPKSAPPPVECGGYCGGAFQWVFLAAHEWNCGLGRRLSGGSGNRKMQQDPGKLSDRPGDDEKSRTE